ncbi:lactonase family protein [Ulvibacterium marinum]|uniref:Lactonase family protein n=1 Tax=Ulvibacterium marinum TaxID=2419782 RepID=A0A3B0C2G8_9FLAO|nr:lactonase family protein [Ulvibacterium marinum]RKN77917.1 lactonase family protein [Ulvibacterium marinum]
MLTFFIGSYTEYIVPGFGGIGHGIYTVQLNPDTGKLVVLHTEKTRNPSYLAISDDVKFLYCVTELDESENPRVRAYRINTDFSLEFLNEQSISGGYPCHLVIHENNILLACYATGNVIQFPLDVSGKLMEAKKGYDHKGSSINKERQEAPHAHQVAIHPNKKDIYVCDLGIDTIKAYHLEGTELTPNETRDCEVSKGGGPRHMVFNMEGSLAYALNELTGNVSVLQNSEGSFEEIKTYSTLPEDYQGVPSASAIRLHPNGKYLYVANRQLDALTIFGIVDDKLQLIDYQYTKGKEIREFNITPDGQWLIACHQNSHDTVVYKIREDAKLLEAYRTKEILSPVCVVFPN